ncbi:MAG: DNA pilot protein [Microviridae sp.]|nr:MAG: DNA pilot protein [Microviridae sp.]
MAEINNNAAKTPQSTWQTIGGALPFIGGVVSSVSDALQSRRNADRQLTQNKELADYQFNKDVSMWKMGNAYNDPSSQMARLQKAGLNPNLVYGTGVAGNTSSQLPKYQAPTADYSQVKNPISGTVQQIQMRQQFELQQEQIENMRAQRTLTYQEAANKQKEWEFLNKTLNDRTLSPGIRNRLMGAQSDWSETQTTGYQGLYQYNKTAAKERALQEHERTLSAAEDAIYKHHINEWANLGVTSSDNPIIRFLARSPYFQKQLDRIFKQGTNWLDKYIGK